MISNWWWWPCCYKQFRAKFGPNIDLCPNYFCLQIHFLECYLSELIHFAYYDRQQWYVVDSRSIRSQKKLGLHLGLFRSKFGPKFGFRLIASTWTDTICLMTHILISFSMVFDYPWCYLKLATKLGSFRRLKFDPKYGFLLRWTLTHIAFLWIHIDSPSI